MPHYESPQHHVVAQVFHGLAGKKVLKPSKDFARYLIFYVSNSKKMLTVTAIINNTGSSVASKLTRGISSALIRALCLYQSQQHILPLIIYQSL